MRTTSKSTVVLLSSVLCAIGCVVVVTAAPPTKPALPAKKASTATSIDAKNLPCVPLFNSTTEQEPDTIIDTSEALITRVSDRVRDRHAREWMFNNYDHYLTLYWVDRTVQIEVVDKVAK